MQFAMYSFSLTAEQLHIHFTGQNNIHAYKQHTILVGPVAIENTETDYCTCLQTWPPPSVSVQ